jgi:hypothetical protein
MEIQASSSQVSTSRGGGCTTKFIMAGVNPTIQLCELHGEGL